MHMIFQLISHSEVKPLDKTSDDHYIIPFPYIEQNV